MRPAICTRTDSVADLDPQRLTRIVLRPVASSMPMGFFAFGIANVVYSALQMRWFAPSEAVGVAALVLVFVVPLQMIASVFGLLSRDAAGAATMGLFGVSWAATSVAQLLQPQVPTSGALAVFLLADSAAFLVIGAASLESKPLLSALLATTATKFVLTALGELGLGQGLTFAAGVVGLAVTAIAFYGALAFLLEDMTHRPQLPVGRRGAAKQAIEGSLREQLSAIEHEAGVRDQL